MDNVDNTPTVEFIRTGPDSYVLLHTGQEITFDLSDVFPTDNDFKHVRPGRQEVKHPLIGVEWEVQLSLPKSGNKQVYALRTKSSQCIVSEHVPSDKDKSLFILTIPEALLKEYNALPDLGNIEIRSNPVKISDLPKEIKRSETNLANIINKIHADIQQPIGVFLPGTKKFSSEYSNFLEANLYSGLTKHVNISIPSADLPLSTYDVDTILPSLVMAKDGDYHSVRVHIRVPYTFCDYRELFNKTVALLEDGMCDKLLRSQYREYIQSMFEEDHPIRFVGYLKSQSWVRVKGLI